MIKCRRILEDEHEERLKRSKCPNCLSRLVKNYEIDNIAVSKKYKIIDYVWSCSNEKSSNCYFVSSGINEFFFESSTASMINFCEEYEGEKTIQYSSKILRRRKGEIHFIELKDVHTV